MALLRFRRLVVAGLLITCSAGFALSASYPADAAPSGAPQSGAGDCLAHAPTASGEYQIGYTAGCSGHDEPELDPVSGLTGSAQDLTWTAVLPSDGTVPVSAVGPTFWWGGTVTDSNPQALFGQGFLEVQLYPDAIVNTCSSSGGFNVTFAPDKFSVCARRASLTARMPLSAPITHDVWHEDAANAILFNHGQCCVAGSRLFIQQDRFDKVVNGVAKIAKASDSAPA
jgi:hypothetical protein